MNTNLQKDNNKFKRFTGDVIFWNGSYGFIDNDSHGTIFFHRDSLKSKVQLLSKVSYSVSRNKFGKHIGKLVAIDIRVLNREPNFTKYKRIIGKLESWNEISGNISSQQLNCPVLFYHTRQYFSNKIIQEGDYLVFHPVKSAKHAEELFALFAYKLDDEVDITFLKEQFIDSGIFEIKTRIQSLLKTKDLDLPERFKIEMDLLPHVDNHEAYKSLKKLITEFQQQDYYPLFSEIKPKCTDAYLILLFEENVINDYDLSAMKEYFHQTTAENKRKLATKLPYEDKNFILKYHIDKLDYGGYLWNLNNPLKTLLDIIFRNAETSDNELYQYVKDLIVNRLEFDELLVLWLNNYIELTKSEAIKYLNIENIDEIEIGLADSDISNAIRDIYYTYFANIDNFYFRDNYTEIVERLIRFKDRSPDQFTNVLTNLTSVLNDDNRLEMSVLGIEIYDFDSGGYIADNLELINDYYKIRYLILNDGYPTGNAIETKIINSITFTGLSEYVRKNPWTNIIKPIGSFPSQKIDIHSHNKEQSISFINDLNQFNKRFENSAINIKELALIIFETMPKYNVEHLRLWMYGYVDDERYGYLKFKALYKELNKEEQDIFDQAADTFINEIENRSTLSVVPCTTITNVTNLFVVYSARMYNLYFHNNSIQLRKKDGLYTDKCLDVYARSIFNSIPENHQLNEIEIRVKVYPDNKMEAFTGLDDIYLTIYTNQIKKALNANIKIKTNAIRYNASSDAFASLMDQILTYLEKNREPGFNVFKFNEPVEFKRVADENKEKNISEVVAIYVLKSQNDYAIVLENINYYEDRATYIFKSRYDDIESQIEKLSTEIASVPDFRSKLISKSEPDNSNYKNHFGYVGNIRKKNIDYISFEYWNDRLNNLIDRTTPEIPIVSLELIRKELDYDDTVPASFDVNWKRSAPKSKIRKINHDEIRTVDFPMMDNEKIKPSLSEKKPDNKPEDDVYFSNDELMALINGMKELNDCIYANKYFK